MEKLSALLVDDEDKALELLKKLLEDTYQFAEIRCADSAQAATTQLKSFTPDLIFLDIKMPGKDGFTFLKELRQENKTPEVVFVTAYDQYKFLIKFCDVRSRCEGITYDMGIKEKKGQEQI